VHLGRLTLFMISRLLIYKKKILLEGSKKTRTQEDLEERQHAFNKTKHAKFYEAKANSFEKYTDSYGLVSIEFFLILWN